MRISTAPLLGIGLDRAVLEPLQRQLYGQMRELILAGRLAAGVRLPASRTLAAELGVSRNTVAAAFEQLLSEGYVEGHHGSGTFVSRVLPDALVRAERRPRAGATPPGGGRRLSVRGRVLAGLIPPRPAQHPAFSIGRPDPESFPAEAWGRSVARHWRRPAAGLLLARDPAGYAPLRRAIAGYLGAVRALACEPGQVIVTSGAQHGLDLALRVLLDPGDSVWIEEPGYPGFRAALASAGALPIPVRVDGEGLSVESGRAAAPGARLAAVSPSHQFPLGITMSLARRLALLDWARENDAWIIEDDYNSEYRYSGRPLAALQGLDGGGRVIYVGSFSKVLFPALRVGYLVVPPDLVDAFARARAAMDDHPGILAQPVLADFIDSGQFAAHVRRTRARYAARQAALVDAAGRHLAGLLDVAPSEAGMHLVAGLPDGADDCAVSAAAAEAGITAPALSDYYAGPPSRSGLLLGFTGASEAEIETGARRLARVLGR